jgi:hypothetical protein
MFDFQSAHHTLLLQAVQAVEQWPFLKGPLVLALGQTLTQVGPLSPSEFISDMMLQRHT